jgi:hypothetical protein
MDAIVASELGKRRFERIPSRPGNNGSDSWRSRRMDTLLGVRARRSMANSREAIQLIESPDGRLNEVLTILEMQIWKRIGTQE